MRHPNEAAEMVIVPVTGVANLGHDVTSTATIHFGILKRRLAHRTGLAVTQPLVPSSAGVFDSLDNIYRNFSNDLDRISDKYANRPLLLLGYSFGGTLARRWFATHETNDCLFTVCAPLAPVDRRRLRDIPFNRCWNNIDAFNRETTAIRAARHVGQLACAHDGVVPSSVALDPLTDTAKLYLLSDYLHEHDAPEGTVVHRSRVPDNHLTSIASPDGTAAICSAVESLIADRTAQLGLVA